MLLESGALAGYSFQLGSTGSSNDMGRGGLDCIGFGRTDGASEHEGAPVVRSSEGLELPDLAGHIGWDGVVGSIASSGLASCG